MEISISTWKLLMFCSRSYWANLTFDAQCKYYLRGISCVFSENVVNFEALQASVKCVYRTISEGHLWQIKYFSPFCVLSIAVMRHESNFCATLFPCALGLRDILVVSVVVATLARHVATKAIFRNALTHEVSIFNPLKSRSIRMYFYIGIRDWR